MAKEEQKEATPKTQEPAGKKSPFKLIIFALVIVLLLGGGAFAWKTGMLTSIVGGKNKVSQQIQKDSKPNMGPIYPMDSFIVNLNEPQGRRYLKVKIALEMDSEKLKSEMDERLPEFRDGIITLLSSKSYKDISDYSGKYQLRQEILNMINGYLKSGKIRNVYFTEFIVQ